MCLFRLGVGFGSLGVPNEVFLSESHYLHMVKAPSGNHGLSFSPISCIDMCQLLWRVQSMYRIDFSRHCNVLLLCLPMREGAHIFLTKHYSLGHQNNMLIALCKHNLVEEKHLQSMPTCKTTLLVCSWVLVIVPAPVHAAP